MYLTVEKVEKGIGHPAGTPMYLLACTIHNSAGKPNFTIDTGSDISVAKGTEKTHNHDDRYVNYFKMPLLGSMMLGCNVSDNKGTYSASRYVLLSGMSYVVITESVPVHNCIYGRHFTQLSPH